MLFKERGFAYKTPISINWICYYRLYDAYLMFKLKKITPQLKDNFRLKLDNRTLK